eukprot:jgi/Tetstr1/444108/TSEL_032007.t1
MSFGVAVWLRDSLPRDMDHTCRSLGLVSTGTDKAASRSTSSRSQQLTKLVLAIISLKKLLASLPALAEILQPARTVLLAAIRSNIQSPMFDEMLSEIQEIIDEDAHAVKNQFMNHIQCCFAVKENVDKFLDLKRSAFCTITQRIQELVDSYRSTTGIDNLKTNYSARRGFGIQLLESLRAALLARMPQVRKLVDNIALLDMLLSFAETAVFSRGLGQDYCKPQVMRGEAAPLAITGGRHAILEKRMLQNSEYHPNDTYLCSTSNFAIITGPNMSGKSTYLRQVGLAVIMAQAGSFVPASFMSFSPFSSICAHAVNSGASAAQDTSNFLAEMIQTAQIFCQRLPRALILIDELGR